MKSLLALFTLAAVSFAAQVPRPAPEFAVSMQDGSQLLLSKYKGKTVALALVFTTCPHCQKTAGLLAQIQHEYAAKGVQVIAAAFDDNARGGIREFNEKNVRGAYPAGWVERGSALEFLQLPVMANFYVPILVFIDRKGVIQSQYIGDNEFFRNQEVSIRAELDKLLKSAPAAPTTRKAHPQPKPGY